MAALAKYGATNVKSGYCHLLDSGTGASRKFGYLTDTVYDRAAGALWASDQDLGLATAAKVVQHSFKSSVNATTSAAATAALAARVAQLTARADTSVTWKSTVSLNAVTKQYVAEVDYNSRTPWSVSDVETSQSAGVTSASAVKVPTVPVSTTNVKPGQAAMGGAVAPATPVAVPTPTAPVKTTTSTGNTTTTTTANNSGTVSQTTTTPTGSTTTANIGIQGVDVSGNNKILNWSKWASAGVKYTWIKVTEGSYYSNPLFSSEYSGASSAGIIRGGYTFMNPGTATGAQEVDYAIAHGGGWSADGQTLPLALDLEWNPYGASCYGLTKPQMNTFIRSAVSEYRAKTGRDPIIYTATSWWNSCVGAGYDYSDVPLWIAQYSTTLGSLPLGWANSPYTVWQNSDGVANISGGTKGDGVDTDVFNGSLAGLQRLAQG